jgi:Zn-dependent protease with chaperone function
MLLLAPENIPHVSLLRAGEREIVINTCLMRVLQGAQLSFALGRALSQILSGHVPYFHVAIMAADRPARLLGLCEEAAREYVWDMAGAWFDGHPKPERERAAALAHAWQLRAELSADRAGLLVCGNVEAACDAVAKMAEHTSQQAERVTWRTFRDKYKAEDVGKLAAIPVKEDPRYNEGYAYYRIQTLRWWATTDEYRQLADRYAVD